VTQQFMVNDFIGLEDREKYSGLQTLSLYAGGAIHPVLRDDLRD
jgi:hypothetical protein